MALTTVEAPVMYNVTDWIEENKKYFLPPVCNKMMHSEGQMKLFYVGGPNQRKDYHIECGEELFYQHKGDMCLKVIERGQHRDVHIREGEIFLLPSCIHHSPQRFEDAVGLVMERERHPDTEIDGLRYFVDNDGVPTTDVLYEAWFYCTDLGSQLTPIIKSFFASEQYKTGKPIPETLCKKLPLEVDMDTQLEAPFSLSQWLQDNSTEIDVKGRLPLFDPARYQFQVYMYGGGRVVDKSDAAEAWIWQKSGQSEVDVEGQKFTLKVNDSLLVPAGKTFAVEQDSGCRALVCYQDHTKSKTWPQ